MKELEIECRGIADTFATMDRHIKVTLQEVDLSFLEDVPAEKILMNCNRDDLLMADVSGGVDTMKAQKAYRRYSNRERIV